MRTQVWLTAVAVVGLGLLGGCGDPVLGLAASPASAHAAVPPPPGPAPAVITGKVVKVTDGDTVHVHTADGADLDVRVLGENSPETVAPGKPVECFGPAASAEAHRVLDGQTVTVRLDASQGTGEQHLDRYARPLRYLSLPSGEDFSEHMVSGGFSRAYKVRGPVPAQWAALVADQRAAQAAHRGLWAPRPAGCGGGL